MSGRTQAEIFIVVPVMQIMPALASLNAEIRYLILLVAQLSQLIHRLLIERRLLFIAEQTELISVGIKRRALFDLEDIRGYVLNSRRSAELKRIVQTVGSLLGYG